jgi:hypothetical protein
MPAEDPLATVLRLVAEGRLTADEAEPILAALDGKASRSSAGTREASSSSGRSGANPGTTSNDAPGRSLRIEVRDRGRVVVNLRLPLSIGRYAIDRIPGLSGEQVERVKAALNSGMTGPVLVVDDENGGVRITID